MRQIDLLVLLVLVWAATTAAAAAPAAARETVRDRLWLWAHDPRAYDGAWGLPGNTRWTTDQAAEHMGVRNVLFIQIGGKPRPPFDAYYAPFRRLDRVMWSLFDNNGQPHRLGEGQDQVYRLAAAEPNVTGVVMDDFLFATPAPDCQWLAANGPSFPVTLTLTLPAQARVTAVELTQTDWPTRDYRSGRYVLEWSADGTTWTEAGRGSVPAAPRGATKVRLPGTPVKAVRVRILDTRDKGAAMSCGLGGLRLLDGERAVLLAGATIEASSAYPGHEPQRLLQAGPSEAPPATGVLTAGDLAAVRRRLADIGGRRLDLAVVVYAHQLDPRIAPLLASCDVVLFWTWKPADLAHLEANMRRLERILPGKRIMLGCYMWDFDAGKPIPMDLMRKQCSLGLRWLRSGRIEGMIFLATNICDLPIEAVEWTRQWVARVGDMPLPARVRSSAAPAR